MKYYIWIIFSNITKAKMQYTASISIQKLAQAFTTLRIHISLGNIRRFYALSVDDRIIFHMHMLTYEISGFCIFLVCVFPLLLATITAFLSTKFKMCFFWR